jgi:predicted polyphosphate/ATP-dependent NAD kinase
LQSNGCIHQENNLPASTPCVGIIANPVSARDIRRVIANASNLQTSERVNIVLRLLSAMASMGVQRVLMMPDKAGMRALLMRQLNREGHVGASFPKLEFLDFEPTSTVEDTFRATRMMKEAGVKAIIVLGGDGTHRAVARDCGSIPIAGLSTGTNNAFPEMREPTVSALAVGLYATGKLTAEEALAPNKMIEISINEGQRRDVAIVDAVISHERVVGARALWKPESLSAVYLTYADPEAIGLSAIGGLLQPVGRRTRGGLLVELASDESQTQLMLNAPIAPGMVRKIPISNWAALDADRSYPVSLSAGVVALDGEREMAFDVGDRVTVTLREEAFYTVDVARCMHLGATQGLFRFPFPPQY